MFRTLKKCALPKDYIFTVHVGPSSKETLAQWHLLEPSDLIDCISVLSTQ